MTDIEIIKALENCVDFVGGGEAMCNNCPLHDCDNCSSEKLKQALDLINRQKAEIEELRSKIGNLDIYPCRVRMNENCRVYARSLDDYDNLIGDIGNEAIKEFAERLKERAYLDGAVSISQELVVDVRDIDTLVEEMCETNGKNVEKMCGKDEGK